MSRSQSQSRRSGTSRRRVRRRRILLLGVGGLAVLTAVIAIRTGMGSRHAEALPPSTPATRTTTVAPQGPLKIVAKVNGRPITRDDLGRECLKRHGDDMLDTVMNRRLILLECQHRQITITKEELDAEIQRLAQRFGLPLDQWLQLLETERGVSPERYRNEIVWPTLAMRRLAAGQLEVNDDEIAREFESRFGPKVQVRMITIADRQLADQVHAMAMKQPDDFAKLAGQYSTDINSASLGGLVQPVRRHMGTPELEKAAFALKAGQISPPFQVADQWVLLKCESIIKATLPAKEKMEQAQAVVVEAVRDRKMRTMAGTLFQKIKSKAHVQMIWNDPARRARMPGVAATINGHPVTVRELTEVCIERHGKEVLEQMISRTLIDLAIAKARIEVTQQDIDAEIARAAVAAGIVTANDQPDFPRWIKMMTEQQKLTAEQYVNQIVWPSAALKKLVAGQVEATEEDMKKSFEANYGPRVRCRVIVMNNLRRAQEVWDMARRKPTIDNFAELARQYSTDPGSKSLGGVVPPIQRHGGQAALEREAFSMKPNDLSGVIQMGDKYILLMCEGITKPVVVSMADVHDLLQDDILERKTRLVMARKFERILSDARITNFLDPSTSHTPRKRTAKNASTPAAPSRG